MHSNDTIAAIATAPGESGIAVIRVSGDQAFSIADRIFRGSGKRPGECPGFTFIRGFVHAGSQDIDEVLLLIMRAPHSYTTEDTVEIQCHGGAVSARRILRQVLLSGARMAEPGEFTRRAFLHGRMDLVQAEAVLDIIRARSDRAASAALEQLEGRLSSRFNSLYSHLIEIAANLEATLDFPEEEIPADTIPKIISSLSDARTQTDQLLSTWDEGHLLHEGALVVIIGKTNVGKSTLLNTLLGKARAIVSPEHGTTRDFIEEALVLNSIPMRVVDTAGIRDTTDPIEVEGIRRTRELIQRADLNILVLDASQPLTKDDEFCLDLLKPKKSLIVMNKIDIGIRMELPLLDDIRVIQTSLLHHIDYKALTSAIIDVLRAGIDFSIPPHAVISERQRQLLLQAKKDETGALDLLASARDDLIVPAISLLRQAIESLGLITGKEYHIELLDSIFSRFCIGK